MTQEKKIILLFAALLGGMLLSSRLEDSVRLCITLLLLSGACVFILRCVLLPRREHEAGLHRLIQQLQAAQDEERESLARDLHDGLGQSLTVIGLTAAFLERNADRLNPALLREYAGDLQRDLQACRRQLQEILRPRQRGGLTADELVTALQELVGCWQQRATDIEFQLSMPTALPEVDGEVGLTAYRLVQEALTNVVRHSAARCCRIAVVPGRGELQLRIEDDGRGMADAANSGLHCGLLGIRERLTKIGGHLSLSGAAGQGVHLQARLPLPNSVARRS